MKKCPFNKMKECLKDECMMWTHLIGKNPQTNQDVDEFGCSLAMLPILLIENAGSVRRVQGSIESFRNETVKIQDKFISEINTANKLNAVKLKLQTGLK